MLQEHSTKSKNAAFESSIKINFGSRYLITYFFFFFGEGHKDFSKHLQIPFSKLILTVLGTAASSDFKYMNYHYKIMKPLYVAHRRLVVFLVYTYR